MDNIEIKARYDDRVLAEKIAREVVRAEHAGELTQVDSYFNVATGRLKLRENVWRPATNPYTVEHSCELIHYERPDSQHARHSRFSLLPMSDAASARTFFTDSFGLKVEVRKLRKLFLLDNLRIHLDEVESLGRFLEFELLVSDRHPTEECRVRILELQRLFKIEPGDLIAGSYADLLSGGE